MNGALLSKASSVTLVWLGLLVVTVGVYLLGLDGQYVPSIGDELVYTHIARATASSGHWLPLVSELDHMRNTKPPLLIWQAIVAGDWGHRWHIAALRWPSVVYTLLVAAATGWTVQRMTHDVRRALLAACVYLAFFGTFRLGRTYLTSAPETFWFGLPVFGVLWWFRGDEDRPAPGWGAHVGWGLALGVGLAYKSFALIAPAAATLWGAQLVFSSRLTWRTVGRISLHVALASVVALSVFGLWFVLDPDPAAVWREFVVGENMGKMGNAEGYWHTALRGGGFSIWAQGLGYAQNAGLLAFVVLGLMVLGVRWGWVWWRGQGVGVPRAVWVMVVWLGVWLVVFMVPSQRSARYLVPAMPALAMLLALAWDRIPRGWFVASLVSSGALIAMLGRIGWAAHDAGIGTMEDGVFTVLAVAVGLAWVAVGLWRPNATRACAVAAAVSVFATLGLATAPFEGPSGRYASIAALQNARVAVPSNFNGQFERFEFLLPGNRWAPYDSDAVSDGSVEDQTLVLDRLLQTHDAVVWLAADAQAEHPPCVPGCVVLGQRWEVKGRHRSGEIHWGNIWQPHQWLFRREWLVRAR